MRPRVFRVWFSTKRGLNFWDRYAGLSGYLRPFRSAPEGPIVTGSGTLGWPSQYRRRTVDRSGKQKLVSEIQETLMDAELVVITQQSGLTVAQVSDLRRKMRAAGAGYKVAKNRLAMLAR